MLALSQDIIESDIDKLKTAYTSGAMVWKFLISRDILILNNIRFPENLIYEDMYFTTNNAIQGGAIYIEGTNANITHNTFYDNNLQHPLL